MFLAFAEPIADKKDGSQQRDGFSLAHDLDQRVRRVEGVVSGVVAQDVNGATVGADTLAFGILSGVVVCKFDVLLQRVAHGITLASRQAKQLIRRAWLTRCRCPVFERIPRSKACEGDGGGAGDLVGVHAIVPPFCSYQATSVDTLR